MIKDNKAPGALAEKLGKSAEKRDNKIAAAQQAHEAVRQDVIATGTERIAQIRVLQSELEKERAALQGVVGSA